MSDYLEILKEWERREANPVIFDHIDDLFPAYGFQRIKSDKDRWVSPLKINLTQPKTPKREKTVIDASDFKFREQGDWDNSVSVIDKLMEDYNIGSVFDAYRFVAQRYCLDMPTFSGKGSVNYTERSTKTRVLEALEDYFVWNLKNNNGALCNSVRTYLADRGFSSSDIDRFRFGFVPAWDKVEAYITSPRMRISKNELEDACRVRSEEGYTSIGKKHVLAIPYRCGGEIKGFLFRAVDDEIQPKYKANTGLDRKSAFFNISEDRISKEIVIVEGELDALTATAAGIPNVVAIGGSDLSGERRNQIFDALNRNTTKIFLCPDLDCDSTGKPNGVKRINSVRRSLHAIFDVSADFKEVYIVSFPEVTDPDEFIRKHGAQAFISLLKKASPWWEYLNRNLSKK